MAERKIARFEPAEIAQHLGLGVVGVEDRVRQESRIADCGLRKPEIFFARATFKIGAEDLADVREIVFACCFIEGNADRIFIEPSQVYSGLGRNSHNSARIRNEKNKKKIIVRDFESSPSQGIRELTCEAMNPLRDGAQSAGP